MERIETFRQWTRGITRKQVLLLLFVYSALVALMSRNDVGNDGTTYFGYMEGWLQGRYTFWYDLEDYLPDTFRNPGFPAIIALLGLVSTKYYFLQFFHYALYCLTVLMVVRILERLLPGRETFFLFAALLLFNPAIPYHIVLITPEIVAGFLLTTWLYIRVFWHESWKKHIVTGLVFGALFQVRPVVLFLPFLVVAMDWILQRKNRHRIRQGAMLLVYIATMLPYGYWNYRTHGVFSVTSLEGGGGVMHLGYWCLKMPGYYENRYWFNGVPVSLINFAEPHEIPANIRAFEREWDVIDSLCAPYLTDKDRRNLPYMKAHGERFVTYNGKYTYEREKLLKKLAVQHYLEDWPYTLKTRLYMVFRLWITGIPRLAIESGGALALVKGLVPTITTAITLLLAVIFIPWALFRRKLSGNWWPVILAVVYWGGIHIPFVIQARYTIPVRLLLLALIAASVHGLFFKKENKAGPGQTSR